MMKKKKWLCMAISFLLLCTFLTGCDYMHVALIDKRSDKEGEMGRESKYWSGVSKDSLTIEEGASKEVTFTVDMKEGSLKLTLENSEGEEVYTLSREGKCSETVVFTAKESGTYAITEKGEKFSGSYKITWGDKNGTNLEEGEEDGASIETIQEGKENSASTEAMQESKKNSASKGAVQDSEEGSVSTGTSQEGEETVI